MIDFADSKLEFDYCDCTNLHLQFNYCKCGARQAAMEAEALRIIPSLTDEQIEAMTALTGAIEQRTNNRHGYSLKKLGLNKNTARSGDNASILTDLGKVVQTLLRADAVMR